MTARVKPYSQHFFSSTSGAAGAWEGRWGGWGRSELTVCNDLRETTPESSRERREETLIFALLVAPPALLLFCWLFLSVRALLRHLAVLRLRPYSTWFNSRGERPLLPFPRSLFGCPRWNGGRPCFLDSPFCAGLQLCSSANEGAARARFSSSSRGRTPSLCLYLVVLSLLRLTQPATFFSLCICSHTRQLKEQRPQSQEAPTLERAYVVTLTRLIR